MAKTTFKGSIMLNPVPAVMITSRNSEGKDNVFTVGWIGTACTKPPMITVAIRPERLSYEYIKQTGSFVVNLASSNLVKAVDYCGVKSGRTNDKFKDMNLSLSEAKDISCGIINQCPVAFECVVKSITPLGTHDLFLAEIVNCHVENTLIDEKGKIHFDKGDLLSYSHGEYFSLAPKPIGKFGFSVAKKTTIKLKNKGIKKHNETTKTAIVEKEQLHNKKNIKSNKPKKTKTKKRTRI